MLSRISAGFGRSNLFAASQRDDETDSSVVLRNAFYCLRSVANSFQLSSRQAGETNDMAVHEVRS